MLCGTRTTERRRARRRLAIAFSPGSDGARRGAFDRGLRSGTRGGPGPGDGLGGDDRQVVANCSLDRAWTPARADPRNAFHFRRADGAGASLLRRVNAPVGEEVATAPPTTAAVVSSARAPSRSPTAFSAPAPERARSDPSPGSRDAEQDAYAIAHRAHFMTRDPAEALRAWDAYLEAFPLGRFAPEARYNRALSLIRLGRTADGRAALAPFAHGDFGGYRQKEAQELIEATEGQ